MRYVDDSRRAAAVACDAGRPHVRHGLPLRVEPSTSDVQRDRLMADILGFLLGGKSGGDD